MREAVNERMTGVCTKIVNIGMTSRQTPVLMLLQKKAVLFSSNIGSSSHGICPMSFS